MSSPDSSEVSCHPHDPRIRSSVLCCSAHPHLRSRENSARMQPVPSRVHTADIIPLRSSSPFGKLKAMTGVLASPGRSAYMYRSMLNLRMSRACRLEVRRVDVH